MLKIEEEMQNFFLKENERKQKEKEKKKEIEKLEPIKIPAPSEDKENIKFSTNNNSNIKIPFAFIGLVSPGSPADEAGLIAGDGIINFDDKIYYGFQNPLQKVAEIVKGKINEVIKLKMKKALIRLLMKEQILFPINGLDREFWGILKFYFLIFLK